MGIFEVTMRATDGEFRYRFWVIGAIFGVAFACYQIDPVNATVALCALLRGASARAVLAIATAVVGVAALLRTHASAYLRNEIVHDPALHSERLVADGPYRRVRNPLYLALILLAVGTAPLTSRLGAIVLIVGQALFAMRLIGREEAALEAEHGESYRRYKAAVPRILPSITPRVPPGDTRPAWAQAFLGEAFFWGFTAAMAAFTVTLDQRAYFWGVAGSFGLYAIAFALGKRRRS